MLPCNSAICSLPFQPAPSGSSARDDKIKGSDAGPKAGTTRTSLFPAAESTNPRTPSVSAGQLHRERFGLRQAKDVGCDDHQQVVFHDVLAVLRSRVGHSGDSCQERPSAYAAAVG